MEVLDMDGENQTPTQAECEATIEEIISTTLQKPKDWKNPPVKSLGWTLLDQLDPNRDVYPTEQQIKIAQVPSEEVLRRMLMASFDDPTKPDLVYAQEIFGEMLLKKYELPKLLLTWKFYILAQAMLAVEDSRKVLKDPEYTAKERLNAVKVENEAVRAMIAISDRITKMLTKTGHLKSVKFKIEEPVEKKPLRKAPTL